MLPTSFLRQLISMYGDSMQAMVPPYLEASMNAFHRNQEQFRTAVSGAFGAGAFKPFEVEYDFTFVGIGKKGGY